MLIWTVAAATVALYCIARAVVDLRQRRYVWGALGFASAVLILFTPIQTHAVKTNLPQASN